MAETLSNIALILSDTGEYENALPLFEQALKIKTDAFGENHFTIPLCIHYLGVLCHKMGRLGDAKAHYENALLARKKQMGEEVTFMSIATEKEKQSRTRDLLTGGLGGSKKHQLDTNSFMSLGQESDISFHIEG